MGSQTWVDQRFDLQPVEFRRTVLIEVGASVNEREILRRVYPLLNFAGHSPILSINWDDQMVEEGAGDDIRRLLADVVLPLPSSTYELWFDSEVVAGVTDRVVRVRVATVRDVNAIANWREEQKRIAEESARLKREQAALMTPELSARLADQTAMLMIR